MTKNQKGATEKMKINLSGLLLLFIFPIVTLSGATVPLIIVSCG
jgi:hypothetical protein